MADIALGNSAGAVAILDQSSDGLAQSDYGLALALAGETARGIDVLANAVRSGENTVKVRQNLAYAYALAGRWREARLMASQDISADKINMRIGEWAQQNKPEDFRCESPTCSEPRLWRTPVSPRTSPWVGDPAAAPALAGASQPQGELPPVDNGDSFWITEATRPELEPVRMAAPASENAFASAPPVPGQADSSDRSFDKAFPNSDGARVFVARPVVQSVPQQIAYAAQAQRKSRPVSRSSNLVPAAATTLSGTATGTHLVQLGSFSSRQNAERAWSIYLSRNPELQKFDKTVSQAMVDGKKFWRVSAGGFDKGAARQMCSTVKHRGGGCIAWSLGNPLPRCYHEELIPR